MFLRRNRRKKKGETYDYWTLVESVRTARGPRQIQGRTSSACQRAGAAGSGPIAAV